MGSPTKAVKFRKRWPTLRAMNALKSQIDAEFVPGRPSYTAIIVGNEPASPLDINLLGNIPQTSPGTSRRGSTADNTALLLPSPDETPANCGVITYDNLPQRYKYFTKEEFNEAKLAFDKSGGISRRDISSLKFVLHSVGVCLPSDATLTTVVDAALAPPPVEPERKRVSGASNTSNTNKHNNKGTGCGSSSTSFSGTDTEADHHTPPPYSRNTTFNRSSATTTTSLQAQHDSTVTAYQATPNLFLDEFLDIVHTLKQLHLQRQADKESDYLEAFVALGGNPDKSGTIELSTLRDFAYSYSLTFDTPECLNEGSASEDNTTDKAKLDFTDFTNMLKQHSWEQSLEVFEDTLGGTTEVDVPIAVVKANTHQLARAYSVPFEDTQRIVNEAIHWQTLASNFLMSFDFFHANVASALSEWTPTSNSNNNDDLATTSSGGSRSSSGTDLFQLQSPTNTTLHCHTIHNNNQLLGTGTGKVTVMAADPQQGQHNKSKGLDLHKSPSRYDLSGQSMNYLHRKRSSVYGRFKADILKREFRTIFQRHQQRKSAASHSYTTKLPRVSCTPRSSPPTPKPSSSPTTSLPHKGGDRVISGGILQGGQHTEERQRPQQQTQSTIHAPFVGTYRAASTENGTISTATSTDSSRCPTPSKEEHQPTHNRLTINNNPKLEEESIQLSVVPSSSHTKEGMLTQKRTTTTPLEAPAPYMNSSLHNSSLISGGNSLLNSRTLLAAISMSTINTAGTSTYTTASSSVVDFLGEGSVFSDKSDSTVATPTHTTPTLTYPNEELDRIKQNSQQSNTPSTAATQQFHFPHPHPPMEWQTTISSRRSSYASSIIVKSDDEGKGLHGCMTPNSGQHEHVHTPDDLGMQGGLVYSIAPLPLKTAVRPHSAIPVPTPPRGTTTTARGVPNTSNRRPRPATAGAKSMVQRQKHIIPCPTTTDGDAAAFFHDDEDSDDDCTAEGGTQTQQSSPLPAWWRDMLTPNTLENDPTYTTATSTPIQQQIRTTFSSNRLNKSTPSTSPFGAPLARRVSHQYQLPTNQQQPPLSLVPPPPPQPPPPSRGRCYTCGHTYQTPQLTPPPHVNLTELQKSRPVFKSSPTPTTPSTDPVLLPYSPIPQIQRTQQLQLLRQPVAQKQQPKPNITSPNGEDKNVKKQVTQEQGANPKTSPKATKTTHGELNDTSAPLHSPGGSSSSLDSFPDVDYGSSDEEEKVANLVESMLSEHQLQQLHHHTMSNRLLPETERDAISETASNMSINSGNISRQIYMDTIWSLFSGNKTTYQKRPSVHIGGSVSSSFPSGECLTPPSVFAVGDDVYVKHTQRDDSTLRNNNNTTTTPLPCTPHATTLHESIASPPVSPLRFIEASKRKPQYHNRTHKKKKPPPLSSHALNLSARSTTTTNNPYTDSFQLKKHTKPSNHTHQQHRKTRKTNVTCQQSSQKTGYYNSNRMQRVHITKPPQKVLNQSVIMMPFSPSHQSTNRSPIINMLVDTPAMRITASQELVEKILVHSQSPTKATSLCLTNSQAAANTNISGFSDSAEFGNSSISQLARRYLERVAFKT